MRKPLLLSLLIGLALLPVSVSAATVDVHLVVDIIDNTWDLYATASQGDNAGMAGFNFELLNIDSANLLGPRGVDLDRGVERGFTIYTTKPEWFYKIFGGQPSIDETYVDQLIFGVGQTGGSFRAAPGSVGVPWSVPVHLAEGTWSGPSYPAFDPVHTAVNVFTEDSGFDADRAVISTDVVVATHLEIVPEPGIITVVALAGLTLIRRPRKK